MKTKLFTTLILSILSLVLLANFTSAAVFSSDIITVPSSVNHNDGSFAITINASYGGSVPVINVTFDQSYLSSGVGSITGLSTISLQNNSEVKTVTAYVNFDQYQSGSINGAIVADPSSGTTRYLHFDVPIVNSKSLSVSSPTIVSGTNTTIVTVTNTGNLALASIVLTITDIEGATLNYDASAFNLNPGQSKDITINANLEDLELGANTATITATANDGTSSTGILTAEATYCTYGDVGGWIRIDSVDDEEKDNSDSWEWLPLDNVELTVEIENKETDYDIDGVIEYGLFDKNENEFIFEDEMDFSVDEDESEEFTIEFKIDPTELNDDTSDGEYIFYIKVYDDDEADEETQCKQWTHDISIRRNKDEVTIDVNDLQIPADIQCDSNSELVLDLYNIGTDKQEDISVILSNRDLDIRVIQDIGDIKVGDKEEIRIPFTIPANAEEKLYVFTLEIYDEDGDLYELEDHDNDDYDAVFSFQLPVSGNCKIIPSVIISAGLESEAKSGQELLVKSTITNTASNSVTYNVQATDYESWASLSDLSPSVVSLGSGESRDIYIKLNVNEEASGSKTFNIEAMSNGQPIRQPVSVTIEQSSGFLNGITGNAVAGNWYLWGIGLLNIILIIVIVVVAIRIAKS